MICAEMGIKFRNIEKVSSEVFSSFESMQTSMSSVIASSTELNNANNKDPIMKSTLSRYKNMYLFSTSKLEKELVFCSSVLLISRNPESRRTFSQKWKSDAKCCLRSTSESKSAVSSTPTTSACLTISPPSAPTLPPSNNSLPRNSPT